jgi:hypothetical protein
LHLPTSDPRLGKQPECASDQTKKVELWSVAATHQSVVPHAQSRGLRNSRLGLGVVACAAPQFVKTIGLQDVRTDSAFSFGEVLQKKDFALEQVVHVDLPRVRLAGIARDRIGPVTSELEAPLKAFT